jgi:hypothetical protein
MLNGRSWYNLLSRYWLTVYDSHSEYRFSPALKGGDIHQTGKCFEFLLPLGLGNQKFYTI